jgi:hypothetical protein
MVFTQDFSKTIDVSLNYFVRAEDATGAYGSNVVDCKEDIGLFRPRQTRRRAGARYGRRRHRLCRQGHDRDRMHERAFPRPKETFGEPGPGEAYVPPGHEKKAGS